MERSGFARIAPSRGKDFSTKPAPNPIEQRVTMNSTTAEVSYRVWACDNQVYGPISLPVLAQWVQEGRVLRDTWIYLDGVKQWRPSGTIEELHEHFPPGEATAFLQRQSANGGGIDPEELRQFAVLSGLSNRELAQLVRLGELRQHRPGELILRQAEPGDALFFVLSGTVRARLLVGGDDKTLVRIPAGEFLGVMAMFTQSPRSADVVAESATRLLRFTAEAFRLLIAENPAAAAPMLFAIARTMANRILADNQRFQKEVASEFVWR